MTENYVYAVFKWMFEQTKLLPQYQYIGSTRSIKLHNYILNAPRKTVVYDLKSKVYKYSYGLTMPMSDRPFLGYGDTFLEARQMAAHCACKYFEIAPGYLTSVMEKNDIGPDGAFDLAVRVLPNIVFFRIQKSSGNYYLHGSDIERGLVCYICDKTAGDIRFAAGEPIIGNPQLMYVKGMADYLLTQYNSARKRLPEIYVRVYDALKDAQFDRSIDRYAIKRKKYVDQYVSEMERIQQELEREILAHIGKRESKRQGIIEYLQAHGYERYSDDVAIHYRTTTKEDFK